MASSLLTSPTMIPTTGSTVVVRSGLPFRSSLPSLRLNRPYNKSSLSISCCSPVSKMRGTSAGDLKPVLERWPEYIPHKLPDKNYVRVFDTTLRDGEQAPGGALTPPQKLEIARQLAKLRVDIMEVGFPVSSEEEFETVKTIAKTVGNEVDEATGYVPVICAIARSKPEDIEAAWEAVKYAKRPKILIFTSTSDIHMKYKLKRLKKKSEKEFLCKILGESIKAGATTVNVADTVGINMPEEYGELVSYLKANTPGIDDVIFSVHCHNDLGVATANTIAGVCAGARQVEVTVNGIGERSGNAPLEEVVMALKCRGEYLMDGVYTRIDTRQIMATSQMVQEYTGLFVQPHKPIVGANCFVHESGIHQDGILKNRSTYEILSPEDVGVVKSQGSSIVIGKLSGRHAVKDRLKELGYELDDEKILNDIFSMFRDLTKQKKRITDDDLKALVTCRDEVTSLNGATDENSIKCMISISCIASTMAVQSVVHLASPFPSLGLTRPYKRPSLFTSCCSSLSNKAGTGATDFKPMLPSVERWPEYIPNKLPDKNYVRVFDTTLRDGEQSPGAALTPPQKLEIARQLSKLRVDIMEVGFPASSEEEFETVKTIAKTVGNEVDEETGYVPVICALARCNHRDIEAVWEAVKYAKRPTILIFISTSDIHMKYKLKKTKEEVIQMAVSSVRYAKSLGFNDIQFGCEDAGRSEKEFLCKILGETIKAGATTLNLGDTVGINMPQETRELVSYLKANTPGIDDVVISVHCHNDLGVATANAIAGICAGARQVDVTVNGIGERSGNAALEEVSFTETA
ncbi:hypothetical protein Bca4012_079444 [Brassica carinata]